MQIWSIHHGQLIIIRFSFICLQNDIAATAVIHLKLQLKDDHETYIK